MLLDPIPLGPFYHNMSEVSVSVVLPVLIQERWQLPMTVCAIETLYTTTEHPFELVLVETGSKQFDGLLESYTRALGRKTKHVHVETVGNATRDLNMGLDAASGSMIVYTGNDVFVRNGWLEALVECFWERDCGAATLASADLIGTQADKFFGQDRIVEAIYGPFMMFAKGWWYDHDAFPNAFADSDLIMRIYQAGYRMYRNNKVIIQHLNRQTSGSGQEHKDRFESAKTRFEAKWSKSTLLVGRILMEGWII